MSKKRRLFIIPFLIIGLFLSLNLSSSGKILKAYAEDDGTENDFVPRIISEYDFEDSTNQGWTPRGGVNLDVVAEVAHSGDYSLKTTNRGDTWQGPSLNMKGILKKGAMYEITGYIKLVEASAEELSTVKFSIEEKPVEGDTHWVTVAEEEITNTEWVEFSGYYTFNEDLNEQTLYVESSNVDDEFYIDDISITLIKEVGESEEDNREDDGEELPILETDFEDGTNQGWYARGDVNVGFIDDDAYSGEYSLLTTNRKEDWQGPAIDVTAYKGRKCNVSVWAKLAPGESLANLRVCLQHNYGETEEYNWIVSNTQVTEGEWVKLEGSYSLPAQADLLAIYVESDKGVPSFYIDDFKLEPAGIVKPIEPLPIQTDIPSIKDAFSDSFTIGAAVELKHLEGYHDDLLKKHYNYIVAENIMKPDAIQPQEGEFNWDNADKIFDYAKENNMQVRYHTLVWHEQVPRWFFLDEDGNEMVEETDPEKREANKELLLERMETHIRTIIQRYGDKVDSWDVVNEVIDPNGPNGLRESEWYRITGTEYIKRAFIVARDELDKCGEVGKNAKLCINDFNTHEPAKRDALYNLVKELLDEGVPVDAVGHQMHINIQYPAVDLITKSIEKFGELGLDNQITELDMSVYTNDTTSYDVVPEELILRQGYRYKELFDELRQIDKYISNVTFWGIADDHSWLHNRPITRRDAPFAFNEQLQAKPAFWGMINPSNLEVLTKRLRVSQMVLLSGYDDIAWDTFGWTTAEYGEGLSAKFKAMWDEDHLYILTDVKDPKPNANDRVEIFIAEGGKSNIYEFKRNGGCTEGSICKVEQYDGGYTLEAVISLEEKLSIGEEIGFDICFTDADQDSAAVCWNDFTFNQHTDVSKYGILVLKEELKVSAAIPGKPKIDAIIDPIWSDANVIETQTVIQGNEDSAKAKVKTMWDEDYLYILAEVTDPLLNKDGTQPHEQDSVEFFIDEGNDKATFYQGDDAQYRVNYDNEQSFGENADQERFETATKIVDGGYIVEAAIPFKTIKGKIGNIIGFDVQVNDADNTGSRTGVITWNDTAGNNYRDTSNFGCLLLADDSEEPIEKEWIIAKDISIRGTGHIQGLSAKADNLGIWENNMFILGTVGEKRRLEGFTLHLEGAPSDMLLVYRAHIQTDGDKPDEKDDRKTIRKDDSGKLWKNEDLYLGTKGDKKRVEGIELKLINKNTGKEYEGYKILYQVHMQEYGWGISDIQNDLKDDKKLNDSCDKWAENGDFAGTRGQHRRIEAICIKIFKKQIK
ncbi:MAG: hypothetical protein ACFWUE_08020 [Xylanivirga thermophila]|jgi:endo-1,4-beta-xylanase|uniref:endo-1,4-beta-xylanase n=1 Tax=Xylanivirga thermophila TaxID=2496273 RepID=UPI0039F4A596